MARWQTLDHNGGDRAEEHRSTQRQQGGQRDRRTELVAHDDDHAGGRDQGPRDAAEREPLEADHRGKRERHQWRHREHDRTHRRRRAAHAHVEQGGRGDEGETEQQGAHEVRATRERNVQRDRQGGEDRYGHRVAQGGGPEGRQLEAPQADRHRDGPGDQDEADERRQCDTVGTHGDEANATGQGFTILPEGRGRVRTRRPRVSAHRRATRRGRPRRRAGVVRAAGCGRRRRGGDHPWTASARR